MSTESGLPGGGGGVYFNRCVFNIILKVKDYGSALDTRWLTVLVQFTQIDTNTQLSATPLYTRLHFS